MKITLKKPYIIAVDFDGTVCSHNYPEIGKPNKEILHMLIKLKEGGCSLILWTCRGGQYLEDAIKWCKKQGLEFDAINDDLPEIKSFNKLPKSCKVYADYYVDDKSLPLDRLNKLYLAVTPEGD